MKRTLSGTIMVSIVLVSLLFCGVAYAQDEELPSPGLTPDSSFYFFDKLSKNIGMFFTFGSGAKAKKSLQYAGERLAEARSMAAKNKIREMERATDDYNQYMARVQERLEETKLQGQIEDIPERVAIATATHLEVLNRVKEQVPENARNALDRAREASIDGQINALRVLAEEKPVLALDICDDVTERQMEKIRVRVADNVTAVAVAQELDYAARIAALEDEMVNIAESTGANVTALQQRLAHSTANRLEVLSGVYEKVPEQARPAVASAIENSVIKYEKAIEKLEDKNLITAVTVNETMEKIPARLRERMQVAITNRLQITNAVSDNATMAVRITTEAQDQNLVRLEYHPIPKTTITSANQTREQKESENKEINTLNTP